MPPSSDAIRVSLRPFVLIAGLAAGCAGSMTKMESLTDVPAELPRELQNRFEVKDVAALVPTQRPSASSPAPAGRRRGKTRPQKPRREEALKVKTENRAAEASPAASPTPAAAVVSYPNRR